jgi:hypothetical protein
MPGKPADRSVEFNDGVFRPGDSYFTTVNYASAGSPTTSAVARPDGTLLTYQPYCKEGLLIADIDITAATGLLASRCKYAELFLPISPCLRDEVLILLATGQSVPQKYPTSPPSP